jgi:hypothetical protein
MKKINGTEIEINLEQKIQDALMDDSGEFYFSTFEYRLEGDDELYGDDFRRDGKIIYSLTEAWKAEQARVKAEYEEDPDQVIDYGLLDDESMACDWEEFEVQDECSNEMPEAVKVELSKIL